MQTPPPVKRQPLAALKAHYQSPLMVAFAQFKLGAMLFFFGLVLVYMASQLMGDSFEQELAMAVGLGFAAIGFIMAMAAHVRMVISRLWAFFSQK